MSEVHTLYIVRKQHDINGQLCAHEGRICLIVPNYTEVFAEPIDTKDESSQCYEIEVKADEVLQQADGGVNKLLLWLGDTHSRSRPQDRLTLPIGSLKPIGGGQAVSAPGTMSPKDAAAALFDGYSDEMKLAAIITNTPANVLGAVPSNSVAGMQKWASGILAAGVGQQAAAKAG